MKIAILSFYSGHFERGVERWTVELSKRLAEKHDVWVFQGGAKDSKRLYKVVSKNTSIDSDRKSAQGTILRRFFIDYWSIKTAIFALRLLPVLWKENFDIIIPTDGGWEPAFIRILSWLKGKKLVIVGHAGIGWDDMNNLYSFPDVFVGLSTYAKEWAGSKNPLVKTVYIPNGIDLETFKRTGKRAKIKQKHPLVLCVGALEKGKRHELAIRAVSELKNASLLILGDGDEKEELENVGSKLLGDRFGLKKISFGLIAEYYRAADVFTLPSTHHHVFEMVLLEAMATNLPVVANDDPIRKEIVGDAGTLVDPTDTDAYAKALEKALKKDWGEKPRKQAEKFSWDKVVKQYEKLFKELVNPPPT